MNKKEKSLTFEQTLLLEKQRCSYNLSEALIWGLILITIFLIVGWVIIMCFFRYYAGC